MLTKNIKYNFWVIFWIILSIVIIFTLYLFLSDKIKNLIRYILETKSTYVLIWIVIIVVFAFHFFLLKSKEMNGDTIVTKSFGNLIDNILGAGEHIIIFSTALTLFKGWFIQNFCCDKQYFVEFDKIDQTAIIVAIGVLLYHSIMKIIAVIKETITTAHTEQVLNSGDPTPN